MQAVVSVCMSREFTFFQFDVDEETVRAVMAAIPGMEPLSRESQQAEEESDDVSEAEAAGTETDETTTGSAGGDSPGQGPFGESDGGPSRWTGPSTPWPGAPGDEDEADAGGWRARLPGTRSLLVGGGVLLLGAVGAAAVWYLKLRGSDDLSATDGDTAAWSGEASDEEVDRSPDDDPATAPSADEEESRSYPVDFAPLVGMAFLAVGSLLLEFLQSESER